MVTAATKLKDTCSLEEKLGKSRQHIKKQRNHFAIKFCIDKAMVSPIVMYGHESCTIKKVECQKIDAFKLWCCRRLKDSFNCKKIKPVNLKGNQH